MAFCLVWYPISFGFSTGGSGRCATHIYLVIHRGYRRISRNVDLGTSLWDWAQSGKIKPAVPWEMTVPYGTYQDYLSGNAPSCSWCFRVARHHIPDFAALSLSPQSQPETSGPHRAGLSCPTHISRATDAADGPVILERSDCFILTAFLRFPPRCLAHNAPLMMRRYIKRS